MLKRARKGFTLTELLIVVAIIAVLTAIAVPILVTTLGSAEDARDEANIRAVRSAGVARIIDIDKSDKTSEDYKAVYDDKGNMYQYVIVTATVDDQGTISELKLEKYVEETYKDTANTVDGNGKVTALITVLDWNAATGG